MSGRKTMKRDVLAQQLPVLMLSPNDLAPFCQVVTAYLAYMRGAVPPSKQRHWQIQILQRVQTRLRQALAREQKEGLQIALTHEELQMLSKAMSGFARLVRLLIPVSAERDDVIQVLEEIHAQLLRMFA